MVLRRWQANRYHLPTRYRLMLFAALLLLCGMGVVGALLSGDGKSGYLVYSVSWFVLTAIVLGVGLHNEVNA